MRTSHVLMLLTLPMILGWQPATAEKARSSLVLYVESQMDRLEEIHQIRLERETLRCIQAGSMMASEHPLGTCLVNGESQLSPNSSTVFSVTVSETEGAEKPSVYLQVITHEL